VAEGDRVSDDDAVDVRVQLILLEGVDAEELVGVPVRVSVAVPLTVPDSLIVGVRVKEGVTEAVSLADEVIEGVLEVLDVFVVVWLAE